MNELQDIAFLLATDPETYADFTKSLVVMEAEAEAAKARIQIANFEYRRQVKKLMGRNAASNMNRGRGK